LFTELVFGTKLSVGPPYFEMAVLPLCVPLFAAMPVGPMLSWKRATLWPAIQRLWWAAATAAVVSLITAIGAGNALAALAFAFAAWLIAGSAAELFKRAGVFRGPLGSAVSRLRGIPLAAWGSTIAHAGMGITVAGIAGMSLAVNSVVALRPGETDHFAGYDWILNGVHDDVGSNYHARVADLLVERRGRTIALMHPSRRSFVTQNITTTETSIQSNGVRDLYTVLGDEHDGQVVLRLYVNPLAPWIWLGALVMATGGGLSLADRRLRIGAPSRRRIAVTT
jgi:cytochrome c-type biogenesis protein CcmF